MGESGDRFKNKSEMIPIHFKHGNQLISPLGDGIWGEVYKIYWEIRTVCFLGNVLRWEIIKKFGVNAKHL